MNKIALITGGSSGIGLETAKALCKCGCTVYEMSRKESHNEGIIHISGDVTDTAQIKVAVDEIISREGRIDVLVNNAGFGISGSAEFTGSEQIKSQMEVNFIGCCNMCSAVIPFMRKNKGGSIVNLSSVAAVVPIPFQAFYSASKAAINIYTMALSNEIKSFGISACAVMPGDIKSNFTFARRKETAGDEVYGGRISRSVSKMEKDEQGGMSPEKAGAYIAKIALKKRVKPLYTIRLDYKLVTLLAKILPAGMMNFIVSKLYAS